MAAASLLRCRDHVSLLPGGIPLQTLRSTGRDTAAILRQIRRVGHFFVGRPSAGDGDECGSVVGADANPAILSHPLLGSDL